jgi:putative acetyltransferase
LNLRPARAADVADLALIAQRSYQSAFADILENETLASRDAAFFESRFAGNLESLTMAEDEGKAIGFLLLKDRHIDMLFIDPAFAGMGAGALLLAHAERMGARSLECFRDNHAARRFYERHGWHVAQNYDRDFAGGSRSFVSYVKGESAA